VIAEAKSGEKQTTGAPFDLEKIDAEKSALCLPKLATA
jgi:hypothetical protein